MTGEQGEASRRICIDSAGRGGGFIPSMGREIPRDAARENMAVVTQVARYYEH